MKMKKNFQRMDENWKSCTKCILHSIKQLKAVKIENKKLYKVTRKSLEILPKAIVLSEREGRYCNELKKYRLHLGRLGCKEQKRNTRQTTTGDVLLDRRLEHMRRQKKKMNEKTHQTQGKLK